MKRNAIIILIQMSFFAALCLTSYSQEYIIKDQLKSFSLDGEKKTAEVMVKVSDGYNYLKIKVVGHIKKGEILVELIDPLGELRKNMTVISGPLNWVKFPRYLVQGVLEQVYRNPVTGNWSIRIFSIEAEGEVKIFNKLIYNPGSDLLDLDQIEMETNSLFS